EKKRLEKQRQREKAYRENRKAKKLAENGGKIVKTKVCPHCQKEFTPTSNRQIFCSKDCCYQARQDKTKADREAEKGNHYYRQRVCAVCGSTYWPTHSQQKFCSEECKKLNHNKKTLEFYYKKQKEKELCKDLLQTKEQVSDTNSSEITIIPA
ncbi:MAG: recombinase, partial [Anaerobutyricum hallii]